MQSFWLLLPPHAKCCLCSFDLPFEKKKKNQLVLLKLLLICEKRTHQ